jgi:sigma-E factor negative regulatory protein RseC
MIEQKGVVVKTDADTVWVETERQSTCGQCSARKGCGTGMLANHVGKRFSLLSVPRQGDEQIGQTVSLQIPEQALLRGAFMMYILPLLLLFGGAALARLANLGDAMEIFAGLSGLFLGFLWNHGRFKQLRSPIQAKTLED